MKQKLIKYAPYVIAITAIADTNFELLIQLGLSEKTIAIIKLIGILIALFLPSIKIGQRLLDNSDPIRTDIPKGTKV